MLKDLTKIGMMIWSTEQIPRVSNSAIITKLPKKMGWELLWELDGNNVACYSSKSDILGFTEENISYLEMNKVGSEKDDNVTNIYWRYEIYLNNLWNTKNLLL